MHHVALQCFIIGHFKSGDDQGGKFHPKLEFHPNLEFYTQGGILPQGGIQKSTQTFQISTSSL